VTVALRVVPADRPRMFEQFWRMGLAKNFDQWRDAMRMQQLPIFHTMYADRDGRIMQCTTRRRHCASAAITRSERRRPGRSISAHRRRQDRAVRRAAAGDRSAERMGAEQQRFTVDVHLSMLPDPPVIGRTAPLPGHTQRSQRGIRLLSESGKISLDDLKAMKLSTRSEIADHFVDDLVAAARQHGSPRAKEAAEILARWDRQGETTSDGALLFLRFVQGAGNNFQSIGGYAVPADVRQPLTTPRGFADPKRAAELLDRQALALENEYDTMHVIWGDVIRLRRGSLDLPGNGLPGTLGAIRTISTGPFVNGKTEIQGGDTFYAVIEFSKTGPPRGEALLGYGNWSRLGSKHVDDQLPLASQKKMRPMLRTRQAIEQQLETRTTF
jgi:acyl-homoserine-lactone acylase